MDGDPALVKLLKNDELSWRYDLAAKSVFITRENINELLVESGFSGEVGLLSIDIDGNDYWVWEAIHAVCPVICVCEYNSVFGDVWPLSIPYEPKFVRTVAHFSNLYFGASIVALRSLAARKGYHFLGTNTAGSNAFFVRDDYAALFDDAISNVVALPSKFRESRDQAGQLSYVGGLERHALISELPLVNTETGETLVFGKLDRIYSDDWLRRFSGAKPN
jgi:hypothetical protein